jgi:hypothetical protein
VRNWLSDLLGVRKIRGPSGLAPYRDEIEFLGGAVADDPANGRTTVTVSGVTLPTDVADDGKVAVASGGDLSYVGGSALGDVLTWDGAAWVAGALSLTWAQTLANGRATAGDNPQISNGDATEYVGASATASLTAGADAAGFTGTVSVSRVGGGQSGYAITDGGTPVAALTADTGGAILGSAADLDLTATTDMALESLAGDITHKVTAGQQHRFEVDGNPLLSLTAAAVTYHQPLTSSGTTATLATSAGTWMTGTVGLATVVGNLSVGPSKAVLFPGLTETAALTAGVDAAGFTGMVSVSRVGDGGSGYAITDAGSPVVAMAWDGSDAILVSAADLDLTATTDMALESTAGDITHKVTAGQQHRFEVDGNPLLSLTAAAVNVTQHLGIAAGKTVDWASGTAALTLGGLTWISSNITTTTVSGDLSVGPSKAVLFPGLTETAALTAGVDADGLTGMVSVSRVGDGGSGYAITDAGSPVVAMAWDGSDGIIQAATGSLHLGGDAGTQLSLSAGLVRIASDHNLELLGTGSVNVDGTGDVNIADGYLELGDISATPGTPTDAGRLYVEDGSLKYIGGSGTITPIAPA